MDETFDINMTRKHKLHGGKVLRYLSFWRILWSMGTDTKRIYSIISFTNMCSGVVLRATYKEPFYRNIIQYSNVITILFEPFNRVVLNDLSLEPDKLHASI